MARSNKKSSRKSPRKKRSLKKRSSSKKRSYKRSSTRGCSRGYIRHTSYKRKSYTRKNGTRVRSASVKSNCIKMQGKHGLKVIPKLRKGELSQFGYSSSATVLARHRALVKAVKRYGALSVFRKMNAIMVLNKNKSPALSNKFRMDRNWIRDNYM